MIGEYKEKRRKRRKRGREEREEEKRREERIGKRSVLLGVVKIFPIEEFSERDAGALAKALDGNDLGAFRSSLDQIVDRRGRHSAAERKITDVTSTLLTDFADPFDDRVV